MLAGVRLQTSTVAVQKLGSELGAASRHEGEKAEEGEEDHRGSLREHLCGYLVVRL